MKTDVPAKLRYGVAPQFRVVQLGFPELPFVMTLAQTWPVLVEAGSGLAPE